MMDAETSAHGIQGTVASSRRTLIGAGTAWVLGAAGLLLSASGDEAAARKGVLGGKMGGRRGKDRRGRDKNRPGNNNDNNSGAGNNPGGGNQLGGIFSLGCSVAFRNQSAVTYEIDVLGENGDVLLDCPPGFNATLSADSDAVKFVMYSDWAKNLSIEASNPDIGEPEVTFDIYPECKGCIDSSTSRSLSVGEGFQLDWEGRSFYVERQSDSSDYKMFLVTALG